MGTCTLIQEAQRVSYKIKSGKTTPRHFVMHITRTTHREISYRSKSETQPCKNGKHHNLTADVSTETMNKKKME